MSVIRRRRSLVAIAALVMAVPTPAHATQSATSGSTKCTITAVAPVLKSTTITATTTVTCSTNTTVSVQIGVVEMDGSSEDSRTEIGLTWKSVAVMANKSVTVSVSGTCVSTETGNEELATKAKVQVSSTVASGYDRTVPATDSYAC